MANIKIRLSIDEKIYEEFKRYCEEKELTISKEVELFMKGVIKGEEYDRV